MKARNASSPTSPPPEVQPADPKTREEFVRSELADREEQRADEQRAREPDEVFHESPTGRDVVADAQDATAIVRCGLLLQIFFRVRRGRAGNRVDVDQRRQRVDSRAQRIGGRLGPRLGHMLGGSLFWGGIVAETGAEALEDLIDGALEQQQRDTEEKLRQQQGQRS